MKNHNPDGVWPVPEQFERIYSHAIEMDLDTHRELHVSGQVGIAPDGGIVDSFSGQLLQALKNVEALLEVARMSKGDIVRITYYLTRREDLPRLSEVRASHWDGIRPAVTTVIVAGLAKPELLVEGEVLAQKIKATQV